MARETREQRAIRQAEEAAQHDAEHKIYLAGLPKRLFEAQALAQSLGIEVMVSLTEKGPVLKFDPLAQQDLCFNSEYTYESERWEIDNLESTLLQKKIAIEAREARKAVAQFIFDKLNREEQDALREHIYSLRPFR